MKNHDQAHVLGVPVSSVSFQEESASVAQSDRNNGVNFWVSKLRKKLGSYMQGIRHRVISAPKESEIVNEGFSLSTRIVQEGVERVFEQLFYVEKGEQLQKASRCYLSMTSGPMAGMVFISTVKVAFHSDKLIKLNSPGGQFIRIPYKVLIPQRKIKTVVSSKITNKPNKKYVRIVTVDDFYFWFMGFSCLKEHSGM